VSEQEKKKRNQIRVVVCVCERDKGRWPSSGNNNNVGRERDGEGGREIATQRIQAMSNKTHGDVFSLRARNVLQVFVSRQLLLPLLGYV